MSKRPTPEEQIRFLQNLQRLLNEGQFTASYKFALLMAIADICIERNESQDGTLRIGTEELAEKFILHYWNQALPFSDGETLAAVANGQAAVVSAIVSAQSSFPTLNILRASDEAWNALVSQVKDTVKRQPLWKLQRVGREVLDFLYPNVEQGDSIQLRPGIASCFRTFYPLVKDLVQGHWLMFVRQLKANRELIGGRTDLQNFLFGSDRSSLVSIRPVLREIQSGVCFYCPSPVNALSEVDHFIPWATYSYDLGHNFVLSCKACNTDKSSRLASIEHLEKWALRNQNGDQGFIQAMEHSSFVLDLKTTTRVAEFAYNLAESTNALTWRSRRNVLVKLDSSWRGVLS